jgi:phosphoglycerol geranylgeranyltransferase
MPSLEDIVRKLDTVAAAARIGSRSVLSLDTNPVPAEWTHVTKIDPEAGKDLPLLFPLYLQHTSATEVGGSRDVTGENTEDTFELVADRPVPAFQEPSAAEHVTERTREMASFLAIPEVMNGDAEAMVGTLGAGIDHVKQELGPKIITEKLPVTLGSFEDRLADFAASWLIREAIFEAYIIMNVDSAAAREGNVTECDRLDPPAARRRAMAAEHYLESEVIYLEYSGRFGGEEAAELLETIDEAVSWPRIWYGGGLDDRENARAMLDAGADAVVVGNIFHRIAAEERQYCAAALEELGTGADGSAVEEWVDANVDVAGSSAAGYLSTIPGVADPERLARRYLVATLEAYLGLRGLADGLEADSLADVEAAAGDRPPGLDHVGPVIEDERFYRRLVVALLADAADLEPELPVGQLGVDLHDRKRVEADQ